MKKIAIVGKMCSGKTTIANIIKSINPKFKIYSFGNGVKEIAINLFDMKNKDRSLLVSIASKMKDIDPDIWIKYLLKNIDYEFCIIDDVRHQNELDYLIKNNWTIIHLTVDKQTQIDRIKNLYPDNYQDHIDNFSDISEDCDRLIYPKDYEKIYINTNQPSSKTYTTLYMLLQKI